MLRTTSSVPVVRDGGVDRSLRSSPTRTGRRTTHTSSTSPKRSSPATCAPPIVYVENQQVLERHVHAYLVQRFFHETVPTDTDRVPIELFESLGTVEQFLSEATRAPCWARGLADENEEQLRTELGSLGPDFQLRA